LHWLRSHPKDTPCASLCTLAKRLHMENRRQKQERTIPKSTFGRLVTGDRRRVDCGWVQRRAALCHDAPSMQLNDLLSSRQKKAEQAIFQICLCTSVQQTCSHSLKQYSCSTSHSCTRLWPGHAAAFSKL